MSHVEPISPFGETRSMTLLHQMMPSGKAAPRMNKDKVKLPICDPTNRQGDLESQINNSQCPACDHARATVNCSPEEKAIPFYNCQKNAGPTLSWLAAKENAPAASCKRGVL